MITKEQRQQIIRDFAVHHNGFYNPALFVDEVIKVGEAHPAYEWFEWNKTTAARQYWVWQAREFAVGLRIKFSVEEVRRGNVTVRETEIPFAMSPMSERDKGGGYYVTDMDDPAHVQEFCRQAAIDLERWLRRYDAVLSAAGGSSASIQKQLVLLQAMVPEEPEEEEEAA